MTEWLKMNPFQFPAPVHTVMSTETNQKPLLTRYSVCQLTENFPIVAAGWSANLFS